MEVKMATYLEKVLFMYPNIQHVMYWGTKPDGKPWAHPYDGLQWDNTEIAKPTRKYLDALSDEKVQTELNKREGILDKSKIPIYSPLQDLEDVIKGSCDQMKVLQENFLIHQQKQEAFMKLMRDQNDNMNSMLIALKGFMQLIPEIQKSLLALHDVLQKKST